MKDLYYHIPDHPLRDAVKIFAIISRSGGERAREDELFLSTSAGGRDSRRCSLTTIVQIPTLLKISLRRLVPLLFTLAELIST